MMKTAVLAASVAGVCLVAGVGWIALRGGEGDPFAQCRSSQVAGGSEQIGGPFTLVNAQGETVTDKDVITQPSLLYFGYTFCPDVCPFDVARNADAVDILKERGQSVTPVFISIDPARDTPEAVGDFAANMSADMIGLTGSPEQVKAASQAFRSYYKAHEDGSDYYLVDHSTFSYLVLPNHGFVEFFRRDLSAGEMADRIGCFLDNA